MTLKFKNMGRCRGDEKLYLCAEVSGCDFTTAHAEAHVEANPSARLPVFVQPLEERETGFIAVFVLFDTAVNQVLVVTDAAGDCVEYTVRPPLFTLASKVNGRVNKELCERIRSIDSSWSAGGLALSCSQAVPVPRAVMLKGCYRSAGAQGSAELRVFDRLGHRVDQFSYVSPLVDEEGRRDFSVVVSSLKEPLCISLWDERGDSIGSCLVLNDFRRAELKREMDVRFASAFDQVGYEEWLFTQRITESEAERQRAHVWEYCPKFSIVVPLYKTPLGFFRDMADSVLAQTYGNWELVLVNSTPDEAGLSELVRSYSERDDRVRVVTLEENLGITENTNRGIAVATGDFLCFFDHDDVLEPDLLFEYAFALNDRRGIDLLYCDEDKLFSNGHFGNPTFKPDFNIDMIRDNNYICHLLTIRRSAYDRIEKSGSELDGAQDHAMVLKIVELGGLVHHVPKILYHWRMSATSTAQNADSKPYATEAGIRAVRQHLNRLGVEATVSSSHGRAFRYAVKYETKGNPLVSVVCPMRGDVASATRFLEVVSQADYPNLEVVLVVPPETVAALGRELSDHDQARAKVVPAPGDFSISAWNNAGVAESSGEVLLFCHDDILPRFDSWVSTLVGHVQRSEVGAVGTMSISPDRCVQQAGLAFVGGNVVNLSAGIYEDSPGYIYYPLTTRDVSAVDGVCIALRRSVFEGMGGFDEAFARFGADVDLCFRLRERGRLVVYTPEAAVYHRAANEGDSRADSRFMLDRAHLLEKWAGLLSGVDPYFNPNFSRVSEDAAQYRFERAGAFVPSSR